MAQVTKQNSNHLGADEYVLTDTLVKRTNLTKRFWENRRNTGDGPPYIRVSGRCVRYRWGDVLNWLEKRKCHSTIEGKAAESA
jgi:predicted DNA-binding transcriptional regulator AlpA